MKLTITPEALTATLAVAQPVIKRSSTLPDLEMVLLEAHTDGGLTISGTDLETRAWHTVAAEIHEAGSVCLPPSRLIDFLAAVVADDPITLSVDENHKAELRSGTTRARVAGIDAERFPAGVNSEEPAFDATFTAGELAAVVGGVLHAVAPDESRPVLAGVMVKIADGTLTLAAADGYRLSLRTLDVGAPDLTVIAHGKGLARIARPLSGATSARVMVDARQANLLVDSEVGCWSVRLIEGQFPDFNRIIPRDPPIAVLFNRDDMLRVLKLVGKIDDTATGYMVRFNVQDGQIEVRAGTPTSDQEADAVVGATLERGSGISIAFNAKYLGDALAALDSARVRLELVKADSPALLRSSDGGTALEVLMPMHIARGSA